MIEELKIFTGWKLALKTDAFWPIIIKIKNYLKDKFYSKFQDSEYFLKKY